MSKKQIIILILGCVMLIAGFFVLIRMTQVKDVNNLKEMLTSDESQETAARTGSPDVTADKSQKEQAGFDIMLQKIVDLHIPIWGYVVIFLVLLIAIRFYTFRYQVKSAERSIELREAAENAAQPYDEKESAGPPDDV